MQLVRFLMKMASEYVQIELKNGTVLAGTILSVSPNMNTVLKDARMTIKGEDPITLDSITVRGNSIRYVVLPETIPLDSMIAAENRRPSTLKPPPPKRGKLSINSRGGFREGSSRGRPMRGREQGGGRGNFRGASRGSTMRGGTRGGHARS